MAKETGALAYKIVDLNETNIDEYGAFCLQSKKNIQGYKDKLKWIKKRFKEGLRLKLLLVNEGARRGFRARGFIEYIPSEYAWRGIDAKGYMVVHCIWVVGQNKGKGYGSKLLKQCLDDAKTMNGVALMTSEKGWLPKRNLFIKHGFEKVDSAPPYFELYAKRFTSKAQAPRFHKVPEERLREYASGATVFKSNQCPYLDRYVNLVAATAKQANMPFRVVQIENCKDAQSNVHPYGTFCIMLNGKVVSYCPIGKKDLLASLQNK